ncbi:MAG: flagella basal body P-ring formation protein FlgA, partial [Chthoniobacteraceae bacterium]|nr:flagella basal body P-ring formation protein FlgA [Chthoniobacteraceae bacterium]
MTSVSPIHPPARRGARITAIVGALALALLGGTAHAQLERLLAPVEPVPTAAKPEPAAAPAPAPEKKARDPKTFTAEDLLGELKAQLADHYTLGGDLVLELARPWGALSLPSSDVTVSIIEYPRDGLSNAFNLRCKITSGDQAIGEWQVSLRARLWQEVWVAAARLERGQELDETMVNARKADILQKRGTLLTTDAKPSAYELVQPVNAETPLTKRDVVEKPVIRKNQIVEVVAKRG